MKTSLIALVLLCASARAVAADAAESTDHANLQGVWLAHSESQNGSTREVTYRYVFAGDKVTFTDETGKELTYSFTLDTASNPKLIALLPEGAPANTTPVSVAYELAGDGLKIVVAAPGSRPTDISDKNNQELIVCRRKGA